MRADHIIRLRRLRPWLFSCVCKCRFGLKREHSPRRPRLRLVRRAANCRRAFEIGQREDRTRASAGESVPHPPIFGFVKAAEEIAVGGGTPGGGTPEDGAGMVRVGEVMQVFEELYSRIHDDGTTNGRLRKWLRTSRGLLLSDEALVPCSGRGVKLDEVERLAAVSAANLERLFNEEMRAEQQARSTSVLKVLPPVFPRARVVSLSDVTSVKVSPAPSANDATGPAIKIGAHPPWPYVFLNSRLVAYSCAYIR